jgi:hypothetical protein
MATWFSKDKKTMVNLDMVSSFNYFNADDLSKFCDPFGHGAPQEINEVKMHGHFLILRTMGHEFQFRGEEALELYKKLSNTRQVL